MNNIDLNKIEFTLNDLFEMYKQGVKDGIGKCAWWKNGTMYVGTTGRTYKDALEKVDKMDKKDILEMINTSM